MAFKYYNEDSKYNLKQRRIISRWLQLVAESEGYATEAVNIIFCSAKRLLEINIEFLQHDYFTDVITFDYSDLEIDKYISGDIFIDVETVADNAKIYGTTALREMHRVIVHGVIHLCGQGDKTPETAVEMRAKEEKYLTLLDTLMMS